MTGSDRFCRVATLILVTVLISACADEGASGTREWAHYYVDRVLDEAAPDNTSTPAVDSLVLD